VSFVIRFASVASLVVPGHANREPGNLEISVSMLSIAPE